MATYHTSRFHPSPLVAAIGRLHAAGVRPEHFNPLWGLARLFSSAAMARAQRSPHRRADARASRARAA